VQRPVGAGRSEGGEDLRARAEGECGDDGYLGDTYESCVSFVCGGRDEELNISCE